MTLSRSSSAWVLVGLQTLLALFFFHYLKGALPPGTREINIFLAPTWFGVLNGLNFGLALVLAFCAIWRYEITGIVLLFAIHIVCPLLFFTDLTRNPYFTQIALLNIWISFIWIAWIWDSFRKKSFVLPRTPLNLPLLVFLGMTTVSWVLAFISHTPTFYEPIFWEGLKRWLFLAVNCIAVFFIAVNLEEKWRTRFIWTTFLIAGIAASYGLMQFYGIERIWQKTLTPFANRPVSTFGNPNFLSSYLLLVIPLLTITTLTSKKALKTAVSLGLLIIVVTGLIATMTRSTWVGAFVSLAILPFSKSIRVFIRNNMKRFGIIVAILLATVVFWPKSKLGGYSNPWERIYELKKIVGKKGYHPWDQRILIWSCSLSMLRDHPLFGKGWGMMELFYPYYQGKMLFNPILGQFRTHANNSHNEVMEIWSQTGFFGMGVYVWLWVVILLFGLKLARSDPGAHAQPPGRGPPIPVQTTQSGLWAWAFTAAAVGMFVDNFFGNVSLHFAVPGFLFWWQLGLLFGSNRIKQESKKPVKESPVDNWIVTTDHNGKKSLLSLAMVFFIGVSIFNFRREFQEIFYFSGFKLSKSGKHLDLARQKLETAWLWYPREVNTNYELSNTYARLAAQSAQAGLVPKSESWRKMAMWGYLESLRSNAGYDEIYFNLAATLSQLSWHEDDLPGFTVTSPRGLTVTETPEKIRGSIFNYSRALAINPRSQDGYSFLGNVYLQDREKYKDQAMKLFKQGTLFFPKNKDFWVNLAYLNIESGNFDKAYEHLKSAMMIDPFYSLTRRNLRALLSQMNRRDDPLAFVDQSLSQIGGLIDQKNWPRLISLAEGIVKILPENPQLRLILANAYFESKAWERAEEQYVEALRMDPRHLTALKNLGLTYHALNKMGDARKTYETILRTYPGDQETQQRLQALPQS